LNKQLIHQVLEIEKQAQTIHDAANHDAAQMQKQAEQEAQALIKKSRAKAQEEAESLVADIRANDECERILTQSEEKSRQMETLAAEHFDRAVDYVLERLIRKE
jgi:vacuolar-type H+-ATPase subunit H